MSVYVCLCPKEGRTRIVFACLLAANGGGGLKFQEEEDWVQAG